MKASSIDQDFISVLLALENNDVILGFNGAILSEVGGVPGDSETHVVTSSISR
jgi:hypothetical protein